jgi:hypothetical protein
MRILNCSSVETTIKSLSTLLKTKEEIINSFIDSNKYRITSNESQWNYNNLTIDDILNHFNLGENEIIPDKLIMFHLTSALDDSTFREKGILNLESVIKDKIFSSFLEDYGIKMYYQNDLPPLLEFKGKEYREEQLAYRFKNDKCINGFLINEDAENNTNVSHIRECPEFFWDIGKLIKMPKIVDKWKEKAKPMKLSLLVNFEDINFFEPSNYILKAIEYILFKRTGYWGPNENYMVFLKEDICISPGKILEIEKVNYSC